MKISFSWVAYEMILLNKSLWHLTNKQTMHFEISIVYSSTIFLELDMSTKNQWFVNLGIHFYIHKNRNWYKDEVDIREADILQI